MTNPIQPCWSSVTIDVLERLSASLDDEDIANMAVVCKQWSSVVQPLLDTRYSESYGCQRGMLSPPIASALTVPMKDVFLCIPSNTVSKLASYAVEVTHYLSEQKPFGMSFYLTSKNSAAVDMKDQWSFFLDPENRKEPSCKVELLKRKAWEDNSVVNTQLDQYRWFGPRVDLSADNHILMVYNCYAHLCADVFFLRYPSNDQENLTCDLMGRFVGKRLTDDSGDSGERIENNQCTLSRSGRYALAYHPKKIFIWNLPIQKKNKDDHHEQTVVAFCHNVAENELLEQIIWDPQHDLDLFSLSSFNEKDQAIKMWSLRHQDKVEMILFRCISLTSLNPSVSYNRLTCSANGFWLGLFEKKVNHQSNQGPDRINQQCLLFHTKRWKMLIQTLKNAVCYHGQIRMPAGRKNIMWLGYPYGVDKKASIVRLEPRILAKKGSALTPEINKRFPESVKRSSFMNF